MIRKHLFAASMSLSMLVSGVVPGVQAAAVADNYPARPVTIVVGFAPGGASDILARLLATEIQKDWGQSVVVENRAGASGIIGTQYVVRSAPDGHTLQLLPGNHTINGAFRNDLAYDSVKDITPITLVATAPNMLIVRADSPHKTLDDYLAAAKSAPGTVSYATSGIGTTVHLAGERLGGLTNLAFNHIPYKGSGQSVTAVLSGEVDSAWVALNSALAFVKDGRVRVLGVAAKERSSLLPDVPTFAELGLDGMESDNWLAVSGPAGIDPSIVARIHEELLSILSREAFQQKLTDLGLVPVGMGPDEFADLLRKEIGQYKAIGERAAIRLE